MNSSGFSRIAITFAIMILALWISLDVFASGSNALGKFYFYMMIGGGIVGLFAPKKGFFFLLFLTAYLDYFKRLMILDSGLRQLDLYYVLGIAPATLGGIALSVVYQLATGAVERRPYEGRITFGVMVIVGMGAAVGFLSSGGGMRSVGDLVNAVAYPMLMFIMPMLFRTPQELRYVMKLSILIFIPSVIYYLYQTYFGFTWWEYKYMISGYTIEVRQLGERVVRVFGTLNGAGSATIIYSIDVALLLFAGFWKYRDDSGKTKDPSMFGRVLLAILFGWAAYRTFSRAGWIQGVLTAVCFWAFRSRIMTRALYITVVMALAIIIAMSGYLLKHSVLNKLSDQLAGSDASAEQHQATSLGSMNARLEGFYHMTTDSKLWTPFGVGMQGKKVEQVMGNRGTHDAFSAFLLKFGYVTIFAGMIASYFLLRSLHRFVHSQPEGLTATLASASLASAAGIFFGVTHNSAALNLYPVNFYMYFYVGIVLALMVYQADLAKKAAAVEREANPTPLQRRRNPGALRNAPPRQARPQFASSRML